MPLANARAFRLPTEHRKSPTQPASTTIAATSGHAAGSDKPTKTTFASSSRGKCPRSRQPPYPKSAKRLPASQPRERYRTTEALYKAANSDADTFQAALLIPEVRKKIEAALGRRLSDAQLRALIDNNRTEAIYWYGYLRRLRPTGEVRLPTPPRHWRSRTTASSHLGPWFSS